LGLFTPPKTKAVQPFFSFPRMNVQKGTPRSFFSASLNAFCKFFLVFILSFP